MLLFSKQRLTLKTYKHFLEPLIFFGSCIQQFEGIEQWKCFFIFNIKRFFENSGNTFEVMALNITKLFALSTCTNNTKLGLVEGSSEKVNRKKL